MSLTGRIIKLWSDRLLKARESSGILVLLIFFTNVLDNVLLTAVVPIIPDLLLNLDMNEMIHAYSNSTSPASDQNRTRLTLIKTALSIPVDQINENSKVGWLLSSKAFTQLIANPVCGILTYRIGYSFLLLAGSCIVLFSTMVFAIGTTYVPLFVARCVQGIGSAALTISGMCLIADRYLDDKDRSRAMGIALGGIALGVLGYPFGAVLYASVGKACPFLIIAAFILIDIGLQAMILKPSIYERVPIMGTPMMRLLQDPYILISAGAITFTTMAMASLEPTLPLWTMKTMGVDRWQLGLIFIPDSVGYLIGTNGFGVIARSIGRWICALACMLLMGLCLICLPFATAIPHLILPHFGIGLGLGITDAALMPLLALLMDTRHEAAYGSVYAIAQLAVCLAYSVGPAIAGQIVRAVGFKWLLRGLAGVVLVYSPLCYCLRNPPINDETMSILDSKIGEDLYMEETDRIECDFTYNRLHDSD